MNEQPGMIKVSQPIIPILYGQAYYPQQDKSFLCLQFFLFVLALIQLIVAINIFLMAIAIDHVGESEKEGTVFAKATALKSFLLLVGILGILIHSIGVSGTVKEHYKLSMTYGIINFIGLYLTIFFCIIYQTQFIMGILLWVFHLLVTVMAISFAEKIKRAEEANLNV
jgi:hypothetical protein